MQFEDLNAFLAMGGYGLYVWLSFGISLFVLGLLLFVTRQQRLSLERDVIKEFRRRERIKAARIKEDKETLK